MPNAPATPPGGPEVQGAHRLRLTRRRLLVVGGVAAVAAALAGVRPWSGSGSAPPGGEFPILSVEPPPDVPVDDWVLGIDGLVERPLTVDRATWQALGRREVTADFHCVTAWTVEDVRWGGVAPAVLLEMAGVMPEARYAAFHAHGHLGGGYLSSVPLSLVAAPDTLLADMLDGRPLPAAHGGPLRLVVPRQFGYKSVKWVTRIEITAESRPGYWEQRGYPDDAPVQAG